jgi:hypothetical protein
VTAMQKISIRQFRAALGVALLLFLGACSQPRYTAPLRLIMGVGPQMLSVVTTPSGAHKIKVLASLPHRLDVDVLSRIDSAHILVSTYPHHRIYVFNTKKRTFRMLRKGWNAVYFPATRDIVFLDNPHGGFTAQELWIAPLADPLKARILDRGPFPIQMPVVPIASNAFVYSSWRKTGKQQLWLYNLSFKTFVPLHISGIYPELWLPSLRALLCVNLAKLDRPYSLRSLKGRIVGRLSLGNWYTPALAINNGRTILVGRQGGAMGAAFKNDTLMAYAVQTKQLSVILRRTFVGVGTVLSAEQS